MNRKATELIAEVGRDKEPILITHRGLPAVYLADVESYELQQRRKAILKGTARGEKTLAEGRTNTHEEVEERFSRWLR